MVVELSASSIGTTVVPDVQVANDVRSVGVFGLSVITTNLTLISVYELAGVAIGSSTFAGLLYFATKGFVAFTDTLAGDGTMSLTDTLVGSMVLVDA
jgi:hypothetical protein